jgi:hypothetical protein
VEGLIFFDLGLNGYPNFPQQFALQGSLHSNGKNGWCLTNESPFLLYHP